MNRLEFILAPSTAIVPVQSAIHAVLGETLDEPRAQHYDIGPFVLIVCGDGADPLAREPHERFTIREGWWPEPVGLQIEAAHLPFPRWAIEPDRLAVRPLFYAIDAEGNPIVSTRLDLIAALTDAPVCTEAAAEQLLIEFHLNDRSVFRGIHRVRPEEVVSWQPSRGFCVARRERPRPVLANPVLDRSWIDALAPVIADAFGRGDALELSAGVDSRLVLAIGLAQGASPRVAFTLGGGDEDTVIAAQICRSMGIHHEAVPVDFDRSRIAWQGRRFARRAGFGTSISSYAWLPEAFDRLSNFRVAQIGGGGGECAAGFYYSPLDSACEVSSLAQHEWIRRRLFRSGVALHQIFGAPRGAELHRLVERNALRVLRELKGTWRQRTDSFYLTQRVPNAGGAVLSACACWYRPLQPLLRQPYLEWGGRLPTRWRAHRRMQMLIIHELAPELAAIPFSHGRRFTQSVKGRLKGAAGNMRSSARKLRRRLSARKRTPDLGASAVALALAADEQARASLHRLPDQLEGTLPSAVDAILANPAAYEHELGVLLNVAFARDSAAALRRKLQRGVRSDSPSRIAA